MLVVSKNIGYQLPDGDAYTEEKRCALVFYPAKDEYLYALGGSLDYLGTWLAWERDDLKRGKDAARAWSEATELTRECWTMAYCDDILTTLHNIEKLLEDTSCCDGSTTVNNISTVTTVIVPGVGPAPTHWGETVVADWDEWLEYVCYHAHKFVDDLVASAETLDTIAEIGLWTIEFFANILRAMQFLTLVYPVSYAAALSIKESFIAAGDMSDTFNDVASKFEAGREDIVCAFILGNSVSDAVETVLDDATLWNLLYQFNNYDSLQALVYEGTVDGSVYLPPIKRDDCVCEAEPAFPYIINENYDFELDLPGWTINDPPVNRQEYTAASGTRWILRHQPTTAFSDTVMDSFTLPGNRTCHVRIQFRGYASGGPTMNVEIRRVSDGQIMGQWAGSSNVGTDWQHWNVPSINLPEDEYYLRFNAALPGGNAFISDIMMYVDAAY